MGRLALLGGSYSSRSLIASAQRCLNLYPEAAPSEDDPPTPVAHLLTPGLTTYVTPTAATVRCLYRCTNGLRIAVVGTNVYWINIITGAATLMGTIAAGTSLVSIADNGIVAVIVDANTGNGWWFGVALNGFGAPVSTTIHTITDAAFFGSTRVVYLDGWFVFNRIGTTQFYLSPPFWDGVTAFDGTQIASKTGGADPIATIAVINGNLWLIGTFTTEVWFDSGALDFPFERQPGVFIEHGIAALGSIAETDVELLWVERDRDGNSVIVKTEGYAVKRISNHGVEAQLPQGLTFDAVGFTYQQQGHTFYQLSFPTLNTTWVYDMATGQWHERCYTNPGTGAQSRHRAQCRAFWDNAVYVGDYANGKIYTYDLTNCTDDGAPITRLRAFPHVVKDGARISYNSFIADMDVSQAAGHGASVSLRWSDDRGATFGNPVTLPIGTTFTSLLIRRLGMARDRVFEISWNFAYQTSLQGAWIEVTKAET